MYLTKPVKIFNAETAAKDWQAQDRDWRNLDYRRDELSLYIFGTSGSRTIKVYHSPDGTNWVQLGSDITAVGVVTVTGIKFPYVKVSLTAVAGGNVSAYVG